jgi:hypothetical protein
MAFNPETFAVILDCIHDALPLPSFSDREEVKAWAGELAADCVDLVAGQEKTMAAMGELSNVLNEQFERHVRSYCAANVGKFGDGAIIDRLSKIDWAKLVQMLTVIISLFPKNTPAPSVQEASGEPGNG